MAEALFRVLRAGPLTAVQDGGRPGFARYGVTEGGPMDLTAHAIGQALTGQPEGGAAIEIDVQGLSLLCVSGAVRFALTGGSFALTHAGKAMSGWHVADVREGETIDISVGRWGSWCYLAFAGSIEATAWLGSKSVNPGWSISGATLKPGDEIRVSEVRASAGEPRAIPIPVFARPSATVRAVPGPQERFFPQESFVTFYGHAFSVSSQYNRQGLRLDGPALAISAALDMPSEPILRGAVQVDGGGQASVLMADHQTTGGYPKIATVISADQDALVQLRPRQAFRFAATTVEDAIAKLRRRQARLQAYLASLR